MEELWRRARRGQHTAILGASPGEPSPGLGLRVVRVSCDVPPTTLGPIDEARRKIERILGDGAPLFDAARDRVVAGLRRRLLGDVPEARADAAAVATWNRLAGAGDRPSLLLFDGVDAADDATLAALARIVGKPGWLKLPLVLAFRAKEPTGAAAALLEALVAAEGADSVVRPSVPAAKGPPANAPAANAPAANAPAANAPRSEMPLENKPPTSATATLPPDVLRVLRAGALAGSGFEAELVAALLDVDPLDVLDCLQRAVDAGVPLEDRGEGRFHLPAPIVERLRASVLPSLRRAWHRRLAELLGGGPSDMLDIAAARSPRAAGLPPRAATPEGASRTPRSAVGEPEKAAVEPEEAAAQPANGVDTPRVAPAAAQPILSRAPSPPPFRPIVSPAAESERRPAPSAPVRTADEARAAAHLAAAGEAQGGAERFFAALREAEAAGAYPQAIAYGQRALDLLGELPLSNERRLLRARVLIDLGRLQWQFAGPDASYTLEDAMVTLEQARSTLREGDPAHLRAEISALIAGVCYDLGDAASLDRALDELTGASRLMLDAGDPVGAARLLNDQAAVYVRMGDPVRAAHLLDQSRDVFERQGAADPRTVLELAETDHLLARIPLHVEARPGRKDDAMSAALDHAIAAERAYVKLGMPRELARVWETMGRLELGKGRLDRARARLAEALTAQEALGDVVGLARTTAALSEVLAAGGRPRDAVEALGSSVALNLEKGSPIGLAFNRRALAALNRELSGDAMLGDALREVAARLSAAESALGAARLPGERSG